MRKALVALVAVAVLGLVAAVVPATSSEAKPTTTTVPTTTTAPAPPGIHGLDYNWRGLNLNGQRDGWLQVPCDSPDQRVLGGGFANGAPDVQITSSQPLGGSAPDAAYSGWEVSFYNPTLASYSITAYAICAYPS